MKEELQRQLKTYPKQHMTWQEFDAHVNTIIKAMDKVNYRPDYIYGIPRGGLPLSVTLSNRLGVPMILDDGIMLAKDNKHILACDDLSDTGETFSNMYNQYATKSCSSYFKTAALMYRIGTALIPDFYSVYLSANMESPDYRWIHFPWE
ncbi:MAG: phosphoribosyltransferase domain-containing protein [Firmicutes bacterium]|nr:phosphoribosyltransferase domain-containing protein [Bacillota bacterium]MCL1953935.1 phosphoribosyltransferase domain-containing protein [Bacillota bacterium]